MEITRIDSHQHFWQLERGEYGWLTEKLAPIYRDFAPADLRPLLTRGNVSKTVVVQAAPTVPETEFLLALAESTDFIAGVVGWIDMEADDAVETLTRLAANPYLKGIRPMIQEIADPEWMLKPELDRVFRAIIDNRLCFDALVFPVHLPHLLTLLQRYPELQAVIDHGAKPDIAGHGFDQWAPGITALAEQTKVSCKLSGLLTEADANAGFTQLQPYQQHLLNSFGPTRLLWGSDWPVLNLANSYSGWLAIVEHFIGGLSEQEQSLIMGANAARFYNLS